MAQALDGQSFDVVIIGTGLCQSILAAALSLAGKKVLHVDQNDYYGGNEASFTLCQFVASAKESQKESIGEWTVTRVDEIGEELREHSRKFLIDLRTRLLFCRGSFVDALIEADVAKYLTFQTMSETMTLYRKGEEDVEALSVPCSKSEVFKSKKLRVVEKRQLMKFLQFCMDRTIQDSSGGDISAVTWRNETHLNKGRSLARPQNKSVLDANVEDAEERIFSQFLSSKFKMTDRLRDLIGYTVAFMQSEEDMHSKSVKEVLPSIGRYLNGLGRFGKTAFICPVYGIAECSQAFCRAAAIHGATYVLRESVNEIVSQPLDGEQTCEAVILENDVKVLAKAVVREPTLAPSNAAEPGEYEQRRVVISNTPLLSLCSDLDDKVLSEMLADSFVATKKIGGPCSTSTTMNGRAFMQIPPNTFGNQKVIQAVQLDRVVEATPAGLYIVTLTTFDAGSEGLERTINYLLNNARSRLADIAPELTFEGAVPKLLWQAEFRRPSRIGQGSVSKEEICGVFELPDVVSIDCYEYLKNARAVFGALCPGLDFLSKAQTHVHVQSPASEEEYLSAILNNAPIPQLVDLEMFRFLGGKVLER